MAESNSTDTRLMQLIAEVALCAGQLNGIQAWLQYACAGPIEKADSETFDAFLALQVALAATTKDLHERVEQLEDVDRDLRRAASAAEVAHG